MADRDNEYEESGRSRIRIVLGVIVGILVLLLIGLGVFFFQVLTPAGLSASTTHDDGLVWVRSMYGYGPSKAEQLLDPGSVAIAPNGEIYVTDPQRSQIMVFTSGGAFARLISPFTKQPIPGNWIRPASIAVDADGNLYIADNEAKKIIVTDPTGRVLREVPVPEVPRGVKVVGDTMLVLATGKVVVFNRQGQRLGAFGTRGPAPGQIDAYQGVTTDGTLIYVADSLNGRIQAFDKSGKLVWAQPQYKGGQIGATGKPDAVAAAHDASATDLAYELPQDLTFDGAGRLIVADAFKFQLVAVDPKTGKITGRWGEFGQRDGYFFYPTSVEYDPVRDWFAVADTRNGRVQIVRLPNSGGTVGSMLQRALASPYRYCSIPLGLLLLAVIILFAGSRRSKGEYQDEDDTPGEQNVDELQET